MQTYQEIDPKIKYQRGLLTVLRTKPENLTEARLKKRGEYFKEQPVIGAIYAFKRRLHRLLTKKMMLKKNANASYRYF